MKRTVIVEYLKDEQRNPIIPFGLHCIVSEAIRNNHSIEMVQAPADFHYAARSLSRHTNEMSPNQLDEALSYPAISSFCGTIKAMNPNVIGFTSYEEHINVVELIVRLLKRYTDAYFAIGGPLPTMLRAKALRLISADFAFIGESELFFSQFLEILNDSRPSSRSPGDVSKTFNNHPSLVVKNIHRPGYEYYVSYLDENEMEKFEIDFTHAIDYLNRNFKDYKNNPILSYISSRGCPHRCIFCSGTLGKKFRKVTAHKIISDLLEIRRIAESIFKPKEKFIIAFGDDNFLVDRKRTDLFFRLLASEKLNDFFQFTFQASVDSFFADLANHTIDHDLIENVVKANVRFLTFGTDNFCDEELRRLRKAPYTVKHVVLLVQALERKGIHNNHFCIMSNLHTTTENVLENLDRIIELDKKFKKFIQLRPIMYMAPYYGTQVWKELTVTKNFFESNSRRLELLFNYPGSEDILLADRIYPLSPEVRTIIHHLEHKIESKYVKNIPYYYDFEQARKVVAEMAASV